MVDKIMVLNEGQVADFGSYEELISKYGPFAQILKSFIQEDIETDDEDDLEGTNSKPCLKRPLKNRQNKGLKDSWYLNAGRK